MRIAIMQPYIFPYIGYFQLISAVDKFVILDDVNYINKGWINRNSILINGEPSLFTIPLIKASQNRLICEIKISREFNWEIKLLKKIQISYKKAFCFEAIFPILEEVIYSKHENISSLVHFSLKKILAYLEINTEIVESSRIYNNGHLKAQDKIIDICFKEKATFYLNPSGGKPLYDRGKFELQQLKLLFIRPIFKPYSQFNLGFIPGLSIIDVLMHNTPNQVLHLLKEYELE